MTTGKKLTAITLALVLSLALVIGGAGAALAETPSGKVNRFNVVLVVDKSGSLRDGRGHGTDPLGLRFDAMRLFLGLLTESGNNVGVIVFDNQIRYESGLKPMESMEDKKALIREAEAFEPNNDTDIGSAVLRATELLHGMQEENGLPGMILLLTDGMTDFEEYGTMRKLDSWDRAKQAVAAAREEGIAINGILLNVDGRGEGGEVELGLYANATGGSYEEVNSPEDLTAAFKHFYALINNADYSGTDRVEFSEDGEAVLDFKIPGFGVEEVNVIVEHEAAKDGATLDEVLDVVILRPDGSEYVIAGHELLSSRYLLVKIPEPEYGAWSVRLRGEAGDTADITMVYNSSISVTLVRGGPSTSYKAYTPYPFRALVTDETQPELTEEMLQNLGAVIEVMDVETGDVRRYPMKVAEGGYSCDLVFSRGGEFIVSAVVGSDGLEVRSNEIVVSVESQPLTAVVSKITDMLRYGRFVDDHWELALNELFGVAEGFALEYTISDDCDGELTLEGDVLEARFRNRDEVSFVLTAEDDAGQSADIDFNFTVPAVAASVEKVESMTKYGKFGDGVWELALDRLFDDPKGTVLQYELSDDYDGALSVEDGMLRMDIRRLHEADFELFADDIFCAEASVPFRLSVPGPSVTRSAVSETVKTGLFQEGTWSLPLSTAFRDPMGTALSYTLSDDLGGAAVIENGILRVQCRGIGKNASFKVKATDEYDLSAELPVTLTEKWVTPYYVLQALLALAVLGSAIGFGVFWYRRNY